MPRFTVVSITFEIKYVVVASKKKLGQLFQDETLQERPLMKSDFRVSRGRGGVQNWTY